LIKVAPFAPFVSSLEFVDATCRSPYFLVFRFGSASSTLSRQRAPSD
jgi:hypothetical protein